MLAERAGLRIHEVPVDWVDDPDSRVDIWRTALDDLRGIARLGWALARGRMPLARGRRAAGPDHARTAGAGRLGAQIARFALVGRRCPRWRTPCSTCCCAARWGRSAANLVALLLTAVANTAANRRLTFGVRGRATGCGTRCRGCWSSPPASA